MREKDNKSLKVIYWVEKGTGIDSVNYNKQLSIWKNGGKC